MAVRAAEIHASKPALRFCGVNIAQAVITAKIVYPAGFGKATSDSIEHIERAYRPHGRYVLCVVSYGHASRIYIMSDSVSYKVQAEVQSLNILPASNVILAFPSGDDCEERTVLEIQSEDQLSNCFKPTQ